MKIRNVVLKHLVKALDEIEAARELAMNDGRLWRDITRSSESFRDLVEEATRELEAHNE